MLYLCFSDGYQERHEDFSANPTGGDSFYSSFSDTPSGTFLTCMSTWSQIHDQFRNLDLFIKICLGLHVLVYS